jgi:uncharacterized protein YprB with RNaseH-like and TPR domain
MSSLSDKLKSLGVRLGTDELPPTSKSKRYPIEEVLDGEFLQTPYGEIFAVDSRYPSEHRQGSTLLHFNAALDTIAAWANEPHLVEIRPTEFVFLDTETSGLATGSGTYAFLIGVGRFQGDEFRLAQFFMRDPIEETAQLIALLSFLGDYRGLVTFNGKAFDIPLLNTRFITNGEQPPFGHATHLDLLPLARRLWRDRLPSRALSFLEEAILGAKRTEEDVPGWLIPHLYFDYLRDGDARPLKNIFYHNAMDIISLAALLNHMATILENPLEGAKKHAIDQIAIAKLLEDLGQLDEAARLYANGLEHDLPPDISSTAIQRWSFMEKRRENFETAIKLWQIAAESGEIYAFIELAKYFEHRQGAYQEAILWTKKAMDLISTSNTLRFESRHWFPELDHRLKRLERKLSSSINPDK